MSKCGGNLIKSEENIILITQIAPDLSPAASIYPYILSPASNRYGLECVFEAVAADNSAGVVGFQLLDPPIVENDCGLCLSLLLHLFSDIFSQFTEVNSGVKLVESVSTSRNSSIVLVVVASRLVPV